MKQKFNAIHMALIAAPPLRGKIVAWDYGTPLCDRSSPGIQRWSIIDPEKLPSGAGAFENFTLTSIPTDAGQAQDIACAGFTWLPNGHLLVAGGTQKYLSSPAPDPEENPCTVHVTGPIVGARLVYTFRPQNWNTALPLWSFESSLTAKRYYPSLVLGHLQDVYILRGHTDDTSSPPNVLIPDTYERWFGASGSMDPSLYLGPDTTHPNSPYLTYPRAHLLSNNETFLSAFFPQAATVIDPAMGWTLKGLSAHSSRVYGGSILFPNIDARHTDAVLTLGGVDAVSATLPILDSVQICKASALVAGSFHAPTQGFDWTPVAPAAGSLPNMIHQRAYLNAVTLPDASVLVLGGCLDPAGNGNRVRQAERFRAGQWEPLATMTSYRSYHQTALLLPSGKVLIAGGEHRQGFGTEPVIPYADYEIYSPPYMFHPRPTWGQTPQENVTYGGWYAANIGSMPAGTALAKIVLMRPGAVTHHFDTDQRYRELYFEPPFLGGSNALFEIPSSKNALPPGFYMIFLVNTAGVPSEARWVNVQ